VLSSERITALIRAYADGPRLLESAVTGLSAEELSFSPGTGHWSIHENVVHVADCDLVAAVRIRFVLTEPGATLVGFDQERWARVLEYPSLSFALALAVFRTARESTVEVLRRAPVDAWSRTGANTESGPQTLEWIVEHFADHVPYHLRTIAKRRGQYAAARR